ncbi:uncharacterized protein LOC128132291 [Lactuca sativa]|uniref:uncharacterized protein LOC128132291 n=1 Tax=Lactuca sativa TaxID=4236 RepID=UPI0022AF945E|nr:uncharacterized protein LOC128132291 [Lactuca sativa]
MYSTIAKNTGNSDKQVANMLIAGFTGQLKGWWDNYVDEKTQQAILNTVKTENGITTPNVVYTLTCTIIEHFTGRWSDNSENIRTLLNGLFCKTLTSFRWYKDTFLSRVMELNDCNSVYWKSKFIDGLPNLFAERVKNQLRIDNTIPYEDYTYGKLIGTCIQEDNSSDGEEISDNNSDINMTDYDSNYDSDSEEIEYLLKEVNDPEIRMNSNRGRGHPSYRGGYSRGRGNPAASSSSYRPGNSSQADDQSLPIPGSPLYEEFKAFLESKKENIPNFAQMITDGETINDNFEYKESSHRDNIIILEHRYNALF